MMGRGEIGTVTEVGVATGKEVVGGVMVEVVGVATGATVTGGVMETERRGVAMGMMQILSTQEGEFNFTNEALKNMI